MKLAKNQAKAKQHPEAELLPLKIIPFFTCYHPKIIGDILKNLQKNKYFYLNEVISLMKMKMRLKMKNRSQRYDINRPLPRHGPKHTKYEMFQYNNGYMY